MLYIPRVRGHGRYRAANLLPADAGREFPPLRQLIPYEPGVYEPGVPPQVSFDFTPVGRPKTEKPCSTPYNTKVETEELAEQATEQREKERLQKERRQTGTMQRRICTAPLAPRLEANPETVRGHPLGHLAFDYVDENNNDHQPMPFADTRSWPDPALTTRWSENENNNDRQPTQLADTRSWPDPASTTRWLEMQTSRGSGLNEAARQVEQDRLNLEEAKDEELKDLRARLAQEQSTVRALMDLRARLTREQSTVRTLQDQQAEQDRLNIEEAKDKELVDEPAHWGRYDAILQQMIPEMNRDAMEFQHLVQQAQPGRSSSAPPTSMDVDRV